LKSFFISSEKSKQKTKCSPLKSVVSFLITITGTSDNRTIFSVLEPKVFLRFQRFHETP
jgi:hypothetical protein